MAPWGVNNRDLDLDLPPGSGFYKENQPRVSQRKPIYLPLEKKEPKNVEELKEDVPVKKPSKRRLPVREDAILEESFYNTSACKQVTTFNSASAPGDLPCGLIREIFPVLKKLSTKIPITNSPLTGCKSTVIRRPAGLATSDPTRLS
ncbi:hypothetical protein TSAR_006777 [Trichomalopsis sarcophagae]|uniref:Uncharacterized protein n=1 Tax=Trichomalopsis sarcophagae TaxID=543379 RepID=A0A232FMP0_9HYME|nr:hypothetical protein TSAR_006777 [Trichomalopsis sarcophagae]